MSSLEQVPLSDSNSMRRICTVNPATGMPSQEYLAASDVAVKRAVESAKEAQDDWALIPIEARARVLIKAAKALLDLQEEFAEVISRETGKPILEALGMEVLTGCDLLHFFARRGPRLLADEKISPHLFKHKKAFVTYGPRGVVAVISPWNFPFYLGLSSVAQALVAGNAVVLKPSEWTPQSGRLILELFQAADLPAGLLSCICGDGETGAALVSAEVDQVCFTGSVETGRRVAESCASRFIPVVLELGGKDAMIVCADADLDRAASGAVFGSFANAGQMCTSVERVYVVDEVADAFIRKVLQKTSELRQGDQGQRDIGPMTLESQLRVVERHVEEATSKGARVLAGGRCNPGYSGFFFEPTVLVDVNHEMTLMREETFGPVMPIMRVRDEREAVRFANDTRFGLGASVWTGDKRKGVEIGKQLKTGSVVVNDCLINAAMTELPFGGIDESGMGVSVGAQGLRSFCHVQSVALDRFGLKTEMLWFPYTNKKFKLLKRLARIIWGSFLGKLFS